MPLSASTLNRAQRKRYGVLDIGSNSVRLVIYDVFGSSFVPIYNEKIHAGLGRDLSAMGLLAAMPRAKGIAADLGGASLELIRVENGAPQSGETFALGPFRMLGTELTGVDFQPEALRQRITEILNSKSAPKDCLQNETLYLIGGAWRNLAMIHLVQTDFPLRTMQGYHLTPDAAMTLADWAVGPGRDEAVNFPGLPARRGETLPYGALLLSELIKRLKPARIIVSTTGLREGPVFWQELVRVFIQVTALILYLKMYSTRRFQA